MVESSNSSVASMEMVEEEQTQDKVSRKLIKFQKVVDKGEEDRISALPDGLLLVILSRLPSTKSAIRTGTLSKRWKNIWTWLPVLIFNCNREDLTASDFVSFVDKTLSQCRSLKLKKLGLVTYSDIQFQSQISNWIRYAVSCNVEQLGISCKVQFPLDQYFFISSCFTHLTLKGCILIPTGAISWKNLRSLRITNWSLDEGLIENILSGSPVLETLVLEYCCGYQLLNITSKSVKNLVLSRYPNYSEVDNIIKINAPNILKLTICDDLGMWNLLLLNVSSLVEAYLDYDTFDDDFNRNPKEAEEEMLKGLIVNLRHVKELKIGSFCSRVVSRLEAEGFDFPSNIIKYYDEIWSDSDSDSDSDSVESEE